MPQLYSERARELHYERLGANLSGAKLPVLALPALLIRIGAVALCVAVGASCATPRVEPSAALASVRLPDGRDWSAANLDAAVGESHCYDDDERNCRRYGRLYTWESARQACRSLGARWRLATDAEWRALALHFGGVFDDAQDRGRAAYESLTLGGRSGFDAALGGGRVDGAYDDRDAHGFYWTATADSAATALFYNFGKGSTALYRQPEGPKDMALSVRCISDS